MKTIKIEKDGKEYSLAFTRKTVTEMARNGFRIDDVADPSRMVIGVPQLFAGAFLRFHRGIKQELVDEIWDSVSNKSGLINKLVEMYAEPINALLDEPQDEAKNGSWEVVE